MNITEKRYLRKRKQIINIIENTPVHHQEKDEDGLLYDIRINVEFYDARIIAEKVLSLFGMNKPNNID